jgi:hypothetical protein
MRRPKGQTKPVRVTLGSFPAIQLKRARELARPYLRELEDGLNPAEKREAAARDAARRAEGMFEPALDDYESGVVEDLRSRREIKRMFKVYVRPRWKGKHLYELRRLDVLRLRDEVAKQNGRVIADRVLEALNAFFRWQSNRDEDFRSPMPPIWRLVKRKDLMRSRALDDEEIRALWHAADKVVPAIYGTLVKLLLITGQRLGDWQKAKWSELIDDALLIPAARYKAARDHAVPLTGIATALLATLPRTGDYLFQLRNGHFSNLSKAKRRLDELLAEYLAAKEREFEPFRIHDLRRTARGLLSRARISREIAERLIGHSVGGHVERTYDVYGYWAERIDAANALSDLTERIVNGTAADVIEIGARRRRGADG